MNKNITHITKARRPSWIMRFMPLSIKRHFAARREERDLKDACDIIQDLDKMPERDALAARLRQSAIEENN